MEDVGVQIVCDDGKCVSLTQLYYCQSCKVLKSNADVAEEVDSFFCPHCLENMPSAEATLFLNRYSRARAQPFLAAPVPGNRRGAHCPRRIRSCSKCFECPCCTSTLQTRVSEDGIYYLECSFCRWHSKTIDLVSDKPEALSCPPPPPHSPRHARARSSVRLHQPTIRPCDHVRSAFFPQCAICKKPLRTRRFRG
jgi:hypothetical protein